MYGLNIMLQCINYFMTCPIGKIRNDGYLYVIERGPEFETHENYLTTQ